MEQLIDADTVAIVVTNPSNPCGSVYSKQHLLDILAIAERHFLPIIGDEIYGGLVFKGQQFYSLASLSRNVPILSCGGTAKKYLVPGWRVGWILIYDKNETFKKEVGWIANENCVCACLCAERPLYFMQEHFLRLCQVLCICEVPCIFLRPKCVYTNTMGPFVFTLVLCIICRFINVYCLPLVKFLDQAPSYKLLYLTS